MDTHRDREGIALVFVVLATVVILGALAAITVRVQGSKRSADEAVVRSALDEAAKAGIDMAIERVWNQYLIGNGNTTGNLASYRFFADGVAGVNEDLNHDGQRNGVEYDMNGNGTFDTAPVMTLVQEDAPTDLASGGRIVSLTLERTDDLASVNFTAACTAERGGRRRTVEQTIQVSGAVFQGFEFGILANNINCVLCHADFLSLDLERNRNNPTTYGTFDRIKVACLENLMVRDNNNEKVETNVSGTLYTRGDVRNQSGTILTAGQLASNVDLKAHQFSGTNGKLTQSATGALSRTALQNATTNSEGKLNPFANLYMGYPTDEAKMTDGTLPQQFPAPYPDENGNRRVDDAEFESVVNSANGSIVFELDPSQAGGSLKGGVAYGVPKGQAYTGGALPTASNSALDSLSTDGSYEGNLILVGTNDDPIVINERVAIDGDLVLKGPVKGEGQLLVRGNVYVVGDVTYADAPNTYGQASDGTENGLALVAGGSIMIGDYLTIRGKNNSKDNQKFPDKAGSIDMRTANKTKSLTYGGKTETVAIGYFDAGVTDPGAGSGNQSQFSFTTSELMLFNRMEYAKAQADPTYRPRYYRLRPSQPIYTYTASDEHAVKYSDPGVAVITNLTGATILDLCPSDFWLSEDALRKFWYADEMTRPASGRPFKFDGLLYSNNSIFCISRSKGRHNSYAYGRMDVRGSVVCPDLGVLVPGEESISTNRPAFDLYYDRRVSAFMRVVDTSQVQFQRLAYRER